MAEILFLAHRIPFPPDRGDKIRSWNVLRYLARHARIHLACFADDAADAAHLEGLRAALGARLGDVHVEVRAVSKARAAANALVTGKPLSLTLFESADMRRFVAERLGDPLVTGAYVFSGQMAQYVPSGSGKRLVMDFVDMDSEKFAAYAQAGSGLMKLVHAREAKRLFRFEREVAARADATLFVSEAEAGLFRCRSGLPSAIGLSNGIDADFFDPDAAFAKLSDREKGEGPIYLFAGQMDYRPNIDAVRWFAREVLPLLPRGRFVIAGRSPTAEVAALAGPRIIVTGAVPDMRSWLAAADVVVAPLRIARGIQNKLLEAMAMARPVVASPAAFEGIQARPGRDLLVEEAPEAMARVIQSLLDDPSQAQQFGLAARELVVRSYRWEARLAPLTGLFDLDRPARAAAA